MPPPSAIAITCQQRGVQAGTRDEGKKRFLKQKRKDEGGVGRENINRRQRQAKRQRMRKG